MSTWLASLIYPVRRVRWYLREQRIARRFRGQSQRDIASGLGTQQKVLQVFLGCGLQGALNREEHFEIPEGLTRDALERYMELARRAINAAIETNKACNGYASDWLTEP